MPVVFSRYNDSVRLYFVQHFQVIRIKLDARRNFRFGLIHQRRVGVGDGHQLGVRLGREVLKQPPYVIMVEPNNRQLRLPIWGGVGMGGEGWQR